MSTAASPWSTERLGARPHASRLLRLNVVPACERPGEGCVLRCKAADGPPMTFDEALRRTALVERPPARVLLEGEPFAWRHLWPYLRWHCAREARPRLIVRTHGTRIDAGWSARLAELPAHAFEIWLAAHPGAGLLSPRALESIGHLNRAGLRPHLLMPAAPEALLDELLSLKGLSIAGYRRCAP